MATGADGTKPVPPGRRGTSKTQTQLDAILETFPATTPISIDPTGLTENMVIPDGYSNVHVKTVPGVKIRRTVRGFVIFIR